MKLLIQFLNQERFEETWGSEFSAGEQIRVTGRAKIVRSGTRYSLFEIDAAKLQWAENMLKRMEVPYVVYSWYSLIIDEIQSELPRMVSNIESDLASYKRGRKMTRTTEQDAKEWMKGKIDEYIQELEKVKKTLS